jgi:hypothetical protein
MQRLAGNKLRLDIWQVGVVENIVEYNSTTNTVKNCTHHMIGTMVKQAVQKDCAFT